MLTMKTIASHQQEMVRKGECFLSKFWPEKLDMAENQVQSEHIRGRGGFTQILYKYLYFF